jgi:hypothetical protein
MSQEEKARIYSDYLPDILRDTKEFQNLAKVEGEILFQERLAKEELIQDQWIQTASWDGLLRRAKMLGIAQNAEESLEELRQRVLLRWNGRCPYTYIILLEWLDGCCGAGNYMEELSYAEYTLKIVLELRVKKLQKEIYDIVRYMIPANMILKVLIQYNRYGDIRKMTYGELRKWKHSEIKEEDFKKEV